MKTIWTLFLALIITANFANAQDTLYVYKTGAVIFKQAVTGVDSITFTNPKPSFPTQGLVAWYPFNGNANDESGNGNNGTVNGAILSSDRFGNTDKSYYLNGTTNYLNLNVKLPNTFTVSVWVNVEQYKSYTSQNIGSKFITTIDNNYPYSGFEINVGVPTTNGENWAGFWNNTYLPQGVKSSNLISLNTWYLLSATYDGTILKYYFNGVFEKSTAVIFTQNNTNIMLGARKVPNIDGNYNFFLQGKLDDVGIWNRALTQYEITQLYQSGSNIVNTVTDIDGNVYKTVKIGTQTWMAENLKVTHYRNGDAIPNVTSNTTWVTLSTGAWCDYSNSTTNGSIYGHLYNWYAAIDSKNIAPIGWHVPSDEEWTILQNHLIENGYNFDGSNTENKISKALASTSNLWNTYIATGAIGYNLEQNNKSCFGGLPAGYRTNNDSNIGNSADWWTTSRFNTTNSYSVEIGCTYNYLARGNSIKQNGFSIRCIKD